MQVKHRVIPNNDNVYIIFSEYFLDDLDSSAVKSKLVNWATDNRDTIHCMGKKLFPSKKYDVDNWLDFVAGENSRPDEMVVSILSILSMVHMCVLTKTTPWVTCKGNDVDSCTMVLAYLGKGQFVLMEDIPNHDLW